LLQADFLEEFLPLFKKHRKHDIYLETNGTLPNGLKKIIDHVDIVAMDFKFPSSTGNAQSLWRVHEKFLETASRRELILKAVITDSTTIDDVKRMGRIAAGLKKEIVIVLQPVTPVSGIAGEPDKEMLSYFKAYVEKETKKEVRILGQMHKCLGIR